MQLRRDLSPEAISGLIRGLAARGAVGSSRADKVPVVRALLPGTKNQRLIIRQPGILETLSFDQCERQPPSSGRVEVAVRAVSLNWKDVLLVLGQYPGDAGDSKSLLIADCSGVITAKADDVCEFEVGDEVFGLLDSGLCRFATTQAIALAKKPASLSFSLAAAVPMAYLTAYLALVELARLVPGESVLIHAAAGGVGLAAVAVAQWLGARVLATAGSEGKRAFLEEHGVRPALSSNSAEFPLGVQEHTAGAGVDVVLNSLPGEAVIAGLGCLKPFGRFIEIGKRDLYGDSTLPLAAFRRCLSFSTFDLGQFSPHGRGEKIRLALERLAALFAAEALPSPHIACFDLKDVVAAFDLFSRREQIGKIVIELPRL